MKIARRPKRKSTGGRYISDRSKRKFEMSRDASMTKIDANTKTKIIRTKGNNLKVRLERINFANIVDPKTGKHQKVEIMSVIDNTSNRNFVRRNIMTKGAIIKTQLGDAKITSRPGQDGSVNAVLIK